VTSPRPTEPAQHDGVPPLLKDAAGWAWRLLVLFFALVVLGRLFQRLELATIPLAISILFTALLRPVSSRLERLGIPRAAAAVLTVLIGIAVVGGIAAFVINRAAAEYPELVDQISRLTDETQDWLIHGPLKLNEASVNDAGGNFVDFLRARQGEVVTGVLDAGKTAFEVITALVLTLFLTIFLLYDGPQIWRWTTALFPERHRARVDEVGDRMWDTVSGYVTGTFLVATFHGAAMGLTLAIVGVPLVAPLIVLIFIGAFIPLIGAIIFGGLAVLVALVTKGTTAALIILVVLIVENQLESHVLQPFVVGKHVRLHPMGIALTLAFGALLGGLPGAIFAVPLVAAVNAAVATIRGVAGPPGLVPAEDDRAGEEAPA
jgi:predicted PurR-regulated permease PerM